MNTHEISQLAQKRVTMAGDYSRESEKLGELLELKVKWWVEKRPDHKSDKAAEMAWMATDAGIREMRSKLWLKAAEKEMSAIKTMIEVAQGESRNQF